METRIIKLESEIAHVKTEMSDARANDARHASQDARITRLSDELSDARMTIAGLKGTERVLLPTMVISLALAMLALIIAIPSRREQSQVRETDAPPATSERSAY
jgi:uncharacterized coiled-coil protein SlyX